MVSAQIAGIWRLYRGQPNGNKTLIMQAHITQTAPAGGASEGAAASVSTPEKLLVINSPVVLVNDDILLASFEADAGATIGAVTKSIWSIPVVTSQGSKTIGRAQFANPTITNIAIVAAVETFLAGYRVLEGQMRLSGKIFMDLQNAS